MQLIEDALRRGAEDGSIKPDCGDDAAHILFAMLMGSARLHIYHGYDVESLRNEARTFASARLSA
jgi:hypothetical protein